MNFVIPSLDELNSESDVEQKLLFPLLTTAQPFGFAIPSTAVHSKQGVRRLKIGKGTNSKLYFPDYIVIWAGLPLLVVEAKVPGSDLVEGFAEARLYAAELNSKFPSGVNPVTYVLASNGNTLLAGKWDDATPHHAIKHTDLNPASQTFADLQGLIAWPTLKKEFEKSSSRLKPSSLRKPRRLLGGMSVQQGQIGQNSFGATISADFAAIFNPVNQADRARIAREAYVSSQRRSSYVDPIDRVIRASAPPSTANAKLIEDTAKPAEVISALAAARPLEHQVLLLVGVTCPRFFGPGVM